jgi:hypothetical protein
MRLSEQTFLELSSHDPAYRRSPQLTRSIHDDFLTETLDFDVVA